MTYFTMNPTTLEDREDLILKTIEKFEGIGFNRLQIETGIPKRTLIKYLNQLIKNKVVSRTMKGKKRSNGVTYTVNFSEDTKNAIKHNLGQIAQYNQWYTDRKYRKLNTFPHYLQELSMEYYQNMMSFLFYSVPSYKYGVKRIEELLEIEKKRLDKKFKGKSRARLWNACQQVQMELSFSASDSMHRASERGNYRTRDEIQIDCINPRKLEMSTQQERLKKLRTRVFSTGNLTVDKYRVDYIKDKKIKKLFLELADEYDRLAARLSTIKIRLSWITGGYPFEPKTTQKLEDVF